jgi:hypothetical protein
MDMQPQPVERGSRLLAAHLRSLDPTTPCAVRRLEDSVGSQLARKLVFALAPGLHARCAA